MSVHRRRFLASAGAVGGAAIGARALWPSGAARDAAHASTTAAASGGAGHAHGAHGGAVRRGRVDHAANGFDPQRVLTDFDPGEVERDRAGRPVRQYRFEVEVKDVEIAPGVVFEAWTYNGRIPGPTIRAIEGDRIRVELVNTSDAPHTVHFHGMHRFDVDGVPGAGEAAPGETFVYDFEARPAGTHLYHCHSFPLAEHINRGLYGAFVVDPKRPRPVANEMVMVLNGFDIDGDGVNDVYAINGIAYAYDVDPIVIRAGELQRVHVVNVTEHDPVSSFHIHGNFFHLFRTGTSELPDEFTDVVTMGQAERHMLEFAYENAGPYMFHPHQSRAVERGAMGVLDVT
ncbi:MAG TPA: multicopper oxidase domain-containing protein [Actinomycetota bacterium]|nr:multicopper oxidase domain-containing protein [Actinomycetota bacterium]